MRRSVNFRTCFGSGPQHHRQGVNHVGETTVDIISFILHCQEKRHRFLFPRENLVDIRRGKCLALSSIAKTEGMWMDCVVLWKFCLGVSCTVAVLTCFVMCVCVCVCVWVCVGFAMCGCVCVCVCVFVCVVCVGFVMCGCVCGCVYVWVW